MTDSAQWAYNRPHYATAVVATDGANKSLVTITIRNAQGKAVSEAKHFDLFLSDSTTGDKLTATAASGAVAGKTDGTTGTDLQIYVAKKAFRVKTLSDGTYQLSITDTGKTAYKVWIEIDDMLSLATTLTAASYA